MNKWINTGKIKDIKAKEHGPEDNKFWRGEFYIWAKQPLSEKEEKAGQHSGFWQRCVIWGRKAEVLMKYAKEHDVLVVDGHFRHEKYTSQDGGEKWSTFVRLNDWQFANTKEQCEKLRGTTPTTTTQPDATQPDATQPAATQPDATQPATETITDADLPW